MNNVISNQKYPIAMRALHWAMALIIIALLAVGMYMTDLPKDDPSKAFLYGLHKSFGVTILVLVAIRVLVRAMSAIPALPAAFSAAEKKIIHVGHFALYGLMFLTPTAGYLLSCAAGRTVSWFGVELPSLIAANEEVADFMSEAHETLAYTLLVLVGLHVAAAIKHQFDKNPDRHILPRIK